MCQSRCSTSDPTITKQAPKGEAGVGPSCAFLTNPLLAQPPAASHGRARHAGTSLFCYSIAPQCSPGNRICFCFWRGGTRRGEINHPPASRGRVRHAETSHLYLIQHWSYHRHQETENCQFWRRKSRCHCLLIIYSKCELQTWDSINLFCFIKMPSWFHFQKESSLFTRASVVKS